MYVMPQKEKDALRRINGIEDFRVVEFMKFLDYKEIKCVMCGMLKHGVFVIPGETRWQCIACGKCCTPVMGPTFLPPELPRKEDGSCQHLKDDHKCSMENDKIAACRIWPFTYVVESKKHPDSLIIISTLCTGFGKGPIITDDIYSKLQSILEKNGQVREAFGVGDG